MDGCDRLHKQLLGGKMPVFGVVGNFANHLEQAGEAKDFVGVKGVNYAHNAESKRADSNNAPDPRIPAPKGIFPIFIPGNSTFLGRNCLSQNKLILPKKAAFKRGANIQAEPEVAIIFGVEYDGGRVATLAPKAFCAFNDASLRIDAPKLSQKKNFSRASKGVGGLLWLDAFMRGGICDSYSITSFIRYKNGQSEFLKRYGAVAKLTSYSYFYERLVGWLAAVLNGQKDGGTLEEIAPFMAARPAHIAVSVGATCYTDIAQKRFLQAGDRICVAVFNHKIYDANAVRGAFIRGLPMPPGMSMAIQDVM